MGVLRYRALVAAETPITLPGGQPVRLYDTRTRKVQPLVPREAGKVGIYACGPTVYQPIHIGNARPFITFNWLARFLRAIGNDVTLVANITDVNDKIYAAAQADGTDSAQLAITMADRYIADTNRLGIGRPDVEPRVTAPSTRSSPSRRHSSTAATPTRPRATCTSACALTSAMASSPAAILMTPTRARGSRAPTAKRIPPTSRSGRPPSPAKTPAGTRHGAPDAPPGTSSAPRW